MSLVLCVTGALLDNGRALVAPGFLVPRELPTDQASEPQIGDQLVVELRGDNSETLASVSVPLDSTCGHPSVDGKAAPPSRHFTALVPAIEGGRGLVFRLGDSVIYERKIPGRPPQVLMNPLEFEDDCGMVLSWTGSHPLGLPLSYVVLWTCSGGDRWRPLTSVISETKINVDLSNLPGGDKCGLAVVASDGANNARAESEFFPHRISPCIATIITPPDELSVDSVTPLTLSGQGWYLEEEEAEIDLLTWSEPDLGVLGRGMTVTVPALPPGDHRIVLTVGTGPRTGEATVMVHVNQARVPKPESVDQQTC